MDSFDRYGNWKPSRGRELYVHSHLSEELGYTEGSGLELIDNENVTDFMLEWARFFDSRNATRISDVPADEVARKSLELILKLRQKVEGDGRGRLA